MKLICKSAHLLRNFVRKYMMAIKTNQSR